MCMSQSVDLGDMSMSEYLLSLHTWLQIEGLANNLCMWACLKIVATPNLQVHHHFPCWNNNRGVYTSFRQIQLLKNWWYIRWYSHYSIIAGYAMSYPLFIVDLLFPIPNCCFLHTFGHQKQVPCGDLSFSIFRYEFAQAFYLAWPSFESFLLVLVATIMRALTIIAIESVAWWLASPRSLNLPGESLRGLNGKVIGDFPASRGHRRLTVDSQHFSIKKCGSESEAKYGYLTTLVPWKPCGSHLMPWTATTSRIRNN